MDSLQDPGREYSLLFAANPIPMWVFDLETLQFLDVNEAAIAQYGYSRDELLRMTIADIRPQEDVPALVVDVKASKAMGLRGPALWRHRRKDGQLLTARVTAQDVLFKERRAELVFAQDLSEPERHIAEVHKKEQFLQSILDGLPAIVFVKDCERRFTLVNTAWERFTGVPRDQAVGKTAHDLFPAEVADRIRRDDLAMFDANARTEIEETVPGAQGLQTQLTSRFPLRDEEGRAEGLVGLAVDITERKRAEEQQARLSRVVEQAAESIMITDAEGTMIYVNPAFESVSGYSRAEALGQNPRMLKSGDQDAAFYRRMWDTLARGEVWKGRLVNRRKDGTLFQEDATIGPVRDASGRLVNYVAVKRDVTNLLGVIRLRGAHAAEAGGRSAQGEGRSDPQGGGARGRPDPPTARLQPTTGPATQDRRPERPRLGHGKNAAAAHRGGRPAGDVPGSRPGYGQGRPGTDRAGPHEPGGQRAGRHAGRRPPHDRDAERRAGPRLRGAPPPHPTRTLRHARGHGQRDGNERRDAVSPVRAILHHEGGGQGHRPRPLDRLRNREAERRIHLV